MAHRHFSSISVMIADEASGYLRLPVSWGAYCIWVTRDLESHQTARHFPGKSPADREVWRAQLTTSRSHFSGELFLNKKKISLDIFLLFFRCVFSTISFFSFTPCKLCARGRHHFLPGLKIGHRCGKDENHGS